MARPLSDAARLLRAVVWLRWRILANSLGTGRRRTLGDQVRAWTEVALKVVLALVFAAAALGLAAAAVLAGPSLLAGGQARGIALVAVRVVLGLVLVSLLVFSVFQAARSGGTRASRLLLLPVSRGRLHSLQLGAALGDPWVLVVVPGLLVLTGGIAVLRPAGAAPLLLAALLLLAVLATLSSVVSGAVQLLLRERRRAEWVTLAVFVAWMGLAVLPAAFQEQLHEDDATAPPPAAASETSGAESPTAPGEATDAEREVRLARRAGTFPGPLRPLPSEAFALTLARASESSPAAWQGVGILGLELLLLYAASAALFRRLLADPEGGSSTRREAGRPLPALSVPGLGPTATAVAWALVRAVWRTLQGRLALVMPGLVLPVFAVIFRPQLASGEATAFAAPLLALAAVALALLGQQAVLLNQYAIDGSGLSLELLAPVPARDLVLGKSVGGALLYLAALLPALAVVAAFHQRAPLLLWPAAVCAALATYALFAPLATWVSALLPKPVDLAKIGKEGQAHQGAALLGMASLGLVLGPAAVVGLTALAVWESPALLLAAEAGLAAVCWLVAIPLLHLAAGYLDQRREALFLTVAEEG